MRRILFMLCTMYFSLFFTGCGDTKDKVVRGNIVAYLEDKLDGDIAIREQTFSKLYVYSSKDTVVYSNAIVQTKDGEVEKKFIEMMEDAMISTGLGGMSADIFKRLSKNDAIYRKAGNNWDEYMMISFFLLSDGVREQKDAGYFIIDSLLNVKKAGSINDADLDYIFQVVREDL